MEDTKDPAVEMARKDAADIQPITSAPIDRQSGTDQPKVSVKPLRSFHDSETKVFVKHDGSAFDVTRKHALELRMNGLVEFSTDGDEHEAIADQVKTQAEKNAARAKLGGLDPKNKTTPLKNPKLPHAD